MNYIANHAKDTITPVIVSEESDVKHIEKMLRIVKCRDTIMEVQ
jgi:phosphotransferase system IIA component